MNESQQILEHQIGEILAEVERIGNATDRLSAAETIQQIIPAIIFMGEATQGALLLTVAAIKEIQSALKQKT